MRIVGSLLQLLLFLVGIGLLFDNSSLPIGTGILFMIGLSDHKQDNLWERFAPGVVFGIVLGLVAFGLGKVGWGLGAGLLAFVSVIFAIAGG